MSTLDGWLWRWYRLSLIAGACAGTILLAPPLMSHPIGRVAAVAVTMTLALVWVRGVVHDHTGSDAVLTGAALGSSAAVPWLIAADSTAPSVAFVCLAAAVAASVADLHAADRLWGALAALAASVTAAAAASFVQPPPAALLAVAIVIIVWTLAATSVRARLLETELAEEAALGVIDEREIRGALHPVLRLLPRGWRNREARWRFVELANQLAIRKRRQRKLPPELARLQQLEVMKLRMELAEVARVERLAGRSDAGSETDSSDGSSATISQSR